MKYGWLFTIWMIAIAVTILYTMVYSVVCKIDGEKSVVATVMFFGFLSIFTLTTIACINSEQQLK
jgi:hypothetical protein